MNRTIQTAAICALLTLASCQTVKEGVETVVEIEQVELTKAEKELVKTVATGIGLITGGYGTAAGAGALAVLGFVLKWRKWRRKDETRKGE